MNRAIIGLIASLAAISCAESWDSDKWYNIHESEPDAGTPEYVATSYMRAYQRADAEAVNALCDPRLQKAHNRLNQSYFSERLKKATQWDFGKLFAARKTKGDRSVLIKFAYFDREKNTAVNQTVKLRLLNGHYKITNL